MPKEESSLESSSSSMSQSTIEPVLLEPETSAEELSQDVGPILQAFQQAFEERTGEGIYVPRRAIQKPIAALGAQIGARIWNDVDGAYETLPTPLVELKAARKVM